MYTFRFINENVACTTYTVDIQYHYWKAIAELQELSKYRTVYPRSGRVLFVTTFIKRKIVG